MNRWSQYPSSIQEVEPHFLYAVCKSCSVFPAWSCCVGIQTQWFLLLTNYHCSSQLLTGSSRHTLKYSTPSVLLFCGEQPQHSRGEEVILTVEHHLTPPCAPAFTILRLVCNKNTQVTDQPLIMTLNRGGVSIQILYLCKWLVLKCKNTPLQVKVLH